MRERKAGPLLDDQRKALALAGVPDGGDHPPIYLDAIPKRKRDDPLPNRAAAIRSLRPGDALVVYDAASLGLTERDILDALAAIGQRGATLVVCTPPGEYRWHPDVAECVGLAADGGKLLARESARVRAGTSLVLGRPKLLTGDALRLGRELWGRRDMVSKQVAKEIEAQTGVKVGVRTLIKDLGHKTDAVAAAERKLR